MSVAQMSNDILGVVLANGSAETRRNGQMHLHYFIDRWVYPCRLLDVIIAPGLPLGLFGDVRVLT
jgi:hypothetical protein